MNIYGTITPYETVLCVMMTFQLIFRISFHVIGNIGFILYGKFLNFCMKIMLQEVKMFFFFSFCELLLHSHYLCFGSGKSASYNKRCGIQMRSGTCCLHLED